jgi:pectate lyase C
VPTPEPNAPAEAPPPTGSVNEGVVPGTLAPPAGADTAPEGGGSASAPVDDDLPASAGCPAPQALLGVLQQFAPADEDLAEDFAGYLGEELGALTCATAGSGGARTITQTIVVPPNTIYDGNGETLTADPVALNCDLSEGEQGESQRPLFLLAPGASLKNVTITYPGCEGVHMMGDNVLENVTWLDVGEDAASVRTYFPGGDITILDSEAHHASDKIFQFNAPTNLSIRNFVGSDMGKLVRQNGGTEFEFNVDLNTVTVTEVISAVVQSDSPICFVRHHALSFDFTGNSDRSDRVFRDIPPQNVSEY